MTKNKLYILAAITSGLGLLGYHAGEIEVAATAILIGGVMFMGAWAAD